MRFLQVSAKEQWRQNLHAALVDVLEEQWFVHKLSRKHLLEEKPVFEILFMSRMWRTQPKLSGKASSESFCWQYSFVALSIF